MSGIIENYVYNQKFQWLFAKWAKSNCLPTYKISYILARPDDPVKHSLVLDDIDNFILHTSATTPQTTEASLAMTSETALLNNKSFQETKDGLGINFTTLKLACMCGSEKIGNYILKCLDQTYLSEECKFMLSFVCSSSNDKWALRIAQVLHDNKKKMPFNIYLYSSYKLIGQLEQVFCVDDFEPFVFSKSK